ncbi:MAG: hypothetical protein FJ076_14620 [Cyanobacteria bacterium K_DeepCast_35m_m1_288]|nr:hypothetical protein [Cyanobacteria bacterium K_DeepCast_35m_m1_288]
MSTFPSSVPSSSISKSEYYSSLPWFRRLLAMLNWRPVVDYELREIEYKQREIEFEQSEREYENRKIAHEQRMRQLNSEIEQIEKENARLDALNSKIDAILFSSDTNSTPPPSTPGESET